MLTITIHKIRFLRVFFFGLITFFPVAESAIAQAGIDQAFNVGTTIHSVIYDEFDLTKIPSPLLKVKSRKDQHFLLVVKSKQQLYLYEYDGRFHRVKSFNCTTGAKPCAKWVNGDLKTPEGICFLN